MMHDLIEEVIAPAFSMEELSDSAVLDTPGAGGRLAVTTDSYVVSPLFFPGGDIGGLAVNGTVNDLAVAGARPLYLTAGFVIEEGFHVELLRKVVFSMAKAANEAGVKIVAGDTKVVQKGKGDGIFINTAGVGFVPEGVELSPSRIRPGDRIIVSGRIGEHGIAVMAERNGLRFDPPVLSDTAALDGLAAKALEAGEGLRVMRDPTRGGLATTLKEFAAGSGLCITLEERLVPVGQGVLGACELLGLDPLYVANEGVLVAVAEEAVAKYLLEEFKRHPLGAWATDVGEVTGEPGGRVVLRTSIGGSRLVEMLQGEQLTRIC